MKRITFILLVLLFILQGPVLFASNKYGKEITLKNKTKISEIMANPQKFIGKTVLVEGTVVGVCEKKGCWMDIASDAQFQKIKIKVKDGEIVFPMEEKGKTALVEGTVYEIKMTEEQAIAAAKNEAEEHGKEFDPSTIKGPVTLYQIKGLGAIVN